MLGKSYKPTGLNEFDWWWFWYCLWIIFVCYPCQEGGLWYFGIIYLYFMKIWKEKFHNMLCLMLDPRFKNLCLVSSFIGSEEGVNIVEEYNRWSLYPMLLKYYHYLHPMVESKVECVDQIKDTKFDLDIFEQTPRTSEPTTKLVNREMLIFMCYKVDSKEIKCHFQLWAKHETIFPIFDFFHRTNFRDCWLTNWDWDKIIFTGDTYKLEKISFTIQKL